MIGMDEELRQEQQYLLRRTALEAQSMSREDLIEALCGALEARFRERAYFEGIFRSHGMMVRVEEKYPWRQPETEEEFKEVLGFIPTEEEAERYLEEQYRDATMELDMDEIVLTPDPESGF